MLKIVGFGDNVVDCYSDLEQMFPGGNTLNVAVHASRAGEQGIYVGAVSDDPAGRHIRAALRAERVDVSRLRVVPGRTAYCVIGTRDGEREFLRADLGVSIIEPDAGDLDLIGTADAVHTGRSSHVDAHLAAFAARTRLSYDFAVVHDRDRIAAIAPHCFLASFSASALSDGDMAELQDAALRAGARWCVVTRGGKGAALAGPTGRHAVAPEPARVVDTLGAGDSFIARCLVGLLRAEDEAALLAAAARAAAESCAGPGGFGHPAPLDVDQSTARTLDEIYAGEARP